MPDLTIAACDRQKDGLDHGQCWAIERRTVEDGRRAHSTCWHVACCMLRRDLAMGRRFGPVVCQGTDRRRRQ